MSKQTNIPVAIETRERLKELGKKGETYDQIIRRLLDEPETGETQ